MDCRDGLKKLGDDSVDVVVTCYDEKTEVLTKSGFKFFKDLKMDDEIATLNKQHELEYQKPTNITNQKYSGKMFKLKNNFIDFLDSLDGTPVKSLGLDLIAELEEIAGK